MSVFLLALAQRTDGCSPKLFPQTQWETCQASNVTDGCLLDPTNTTNPLAFEAVDCRLGNVPPYYLSVVIYALRP